MSQYDAGGFNPYQEQLAEPPRTSLLAVSGFVSSVIFCCPLTSLIGLLLGVGGLVSVSASNGRRKGTGLAAAAVLISLLSLAGQAIVLKAFWPRIESYIGAGMLLATGPTEFIHDLETGDLVSARSHLYPSFETSISDAQLQYFSEQINDRYGSFVGWMPPQGQALNVTGPGENSTDVIGTAKFSKGDQSVTMRITVMLGQDAMFEEYGIAGLTIRDSKLGDLVLDATTPGAEPSGEGEPTQVEPPPSSEEGGG